MAVKQYIFNVLIGLDQLVNALRGGSPDETLSAAAWRTEQAGKLGGRIARPLIDLFFSPFEANHCQAAYHSEITGKQLPKGYKDGGG